MRAGVCHGKEKVNLPAEPGDVADPLKVCAALPLLRTVTVNGMGAVT